jgi:hypothetical protein
MTYHETDNSKTRWNFSLTEKKHTLLHTIGFSHPAVETNIKTDEEAPTVQEDTYQMHR